MKKTTLLLLLGIILMGLSCNKKSESKATSLSETEFSEKMNQNPLIPIVDVRTPEEFEKGHLKNAKNIDWNGANFQEQISKLDPEKPVFIYCLSGARSEAAAKKMRTDGFKEVYELKGGIMKWRAANLPETNESIATGMTRQQFDQLVTSEKMVLIDFYADWCAPCKKMKPYLEEIAVEMKEDVQVIRINADDNQALCKELKIDALPVLQLYKNKSLVWNNSGYMSKEDIIKNLK